MRRTEGAVTRPVLSWIKKSFMTIPLCRWIRIETKFRVITEDKDTTPIPVVQSSLQCIANPLINSARQKCFWVERTETAFIFTHRNPLILYTHIYSWLSLLHVQGPFQSDEMFEWYSAGYFPGDLMLRRNCDQVNLGSDWSTLIILASHWSTFSL